MHDFYNNSSLWDNVTAQSIQYESKANKNFT